MRFENQSNSQPRVKATAHARPAGAWRVAAGQALALTPARDGALRVVRGRAWATLTGDGRDHLLQGGQSLALPAGVRLVLEGVGGDVWVDVTPR